MTRRILFLLSLFVIISNSSCDKPQKFAAISGNIVDDNGSPIDSVQFETYVNGELEKIGRYGETLVEYRNDIKVREFVDGYFYTDSLGKFGAGILRETEGNLSLEIRFIKEGYETLSFVPDTSIVLDTVLKMKKN